ncbi:35596_t:CDS:2 [Racocetra persica]|uniref:35596_t:CDS:1 n=1 Tax=Racocetra persica TaxID=160502 RepID=A0ACA9KMR5_9GLOM|nr:35596_t:CDS:2 [Racocetra persica]
MNHFFTIALFVIASLVIFVAAGDVMVNTPTGNLFTKAIAKITWTISGPAPAIAAILSVRNKQTNEDLVIDNQLDLNALSKQWEVNVPPGEYFLVINDGSGEKFSGTFKVTAGVPLPGAPSSPNDGTPAGTSEPAPASPPANKQPSPSGGNPSTSTNTSSQPAKPIGSTNTTKKANSASTTSTSCFGLVGVGLICLNIFLNL